MIFLHATEKQLEKEKRFLKEIRKIPELKEKKKGVFYIKNSAFLHFHFFDGKLFFDLKKGKKWQRIKIPKTKPETTEKINIIEKVVKEVI